MAIERILIWGKTYPELSKKYGEVVCTAGCREDGTPIRLYPVPLRYLPAFGKYKLYNWIEVNIVRNKDDVRPESYKVVGMPQVVGEVDSAQNWAVRRGILFKNPAWHYGCVSHLRAAQKEDKTSLGLVKVAAVERVWVVDRPQSEIEEHRRRMWALKSRLSLFSEPEMRNLDPQEFKIYLQWRCADPNCPGGHTAGIMDWGLAQLGRKLGRQAALNKMNDIADLTKHDLHLLMGNFAKHQGNFGVIGMWYPQSDAYLAAKANSKRKPKPSQQLGLGL